MQDIEEILESYIATDILRKKVEIKPDSSLISSGLLDSLTLLQLISFIEERFDITVTDQEMVPENFQTINAMRSFIINKKETR
jgi:methoxymalonate biosynthesis acyl carrier protein